MKFEHGGDIYSAQKIYLGEILDVSVNLNPMGTPPQVVQAAHDALLEVQEYPDPLCRELRRAIAQKDGVSPKQIFCGNGAAEVIFRLALALRPGTALLTAPTFSEYEGALTQVGCNCRYHVLRQEDQFDVTESILEQIQPPVELVMVCSPNNPTGRLIQQPLLLRMLERCRQIGAVLAVDECFLPLAQEGAGMAPYLDEYPELFLLRAFTKTYAIPALRLGYGLGSPELVERLSAWGPCWNTSGLAQAAGLACCRCPPDAGGGAAPPAAGVDRAGLSGDTRQRQLSALPSAGADRLERTDAAPGCAAAKLRKLPGAGAGLVPGRRAAGGE